MGGGTTPGRALNAPPSLLHPTQAAIASKDYTTAKKTLVQLKVRVSVMERDTEREE